LERLIEKVAKVQSNSIVVSNPSGKLAETFSKELNDNSSYKKFLDEADRI